MYLTDTTSASSCDPFADDQLYSPHDETCRTLAPHYELLARTLAQHPNERLQKLRVAGTQARPGERAHIIRYVESLTYRQGGVMRQPSTSRATTSPDRT